MSELKEGDFVTFIESGTSLVFQGETCKVVDIMGKEVKVLTSQGNSGRFLYWELVKIDLEWIDKERQKDAPTQIPSDRPTKPVPQQSEEERKKVMEALMGLFGIDKQEGVRMYSDESHFPAWMNNETAINLPPNQYKSITIEPILKDGRIVSFKVSLD